MAFLHWFTLADFLDSPVATLLGTTADPKELDEIVARLESNPTVQSASWSVRTTD
jgi:hypothetical protein